MVGILEGPAEVSIDGICDECVVLGGIDGATLGLVVVGEKDGGLDGI